jgi:hypothetical protein
MPNEPLGNGSGGSVVVVVGSVVVVVGGIVGGVVLGGSDVTVVFWVAKEVTASGEVSDVHAEIISMSAAADDLLLNR